jgi:hypothetical protein
MNIKMLLGKLDVTVTRSVSAVLLLGCLLLISCQSEKSKLAISWEAKNIDKSSLLEISANALSDDLVSKIKNDYANSPFDSDYPELVLFSVFTHKTKDKLFIFFDVRYVDDIQVVYEVGQDGHLLGKYMHSVWNN